MALEGSDVADDIGAQVEEELLLEPGQVLVGEVAVQGPVSVGGLDGVVQLGGVDRVRAAEGSHQADRLAVRVAQGVVAFADRALQTCFGIALGGVQLLQENVVVAVGRGQELLQGCLVLRYGIEVALRQERCGLVQQCGGAPGVVAQRAQFLLALVEDLPALLDVVLGLLKLCGERVQAGLGFQGALLLLELLDVRGCGRPVEFRVGVDAGQEGEGGARSGAAARSAAGPCPGCSRPPPARRTGFSAGSGRSCLSVAPAG
jgi:hypothetical protein